jgi:sugar lactone lactonase YvrE
VASGTAATLGDGGLAKQATLNRPWGIGFDAAGDLYIADTRNNRIRRVVQP